jgi:MFS family permease
MVSSPEGDSSPRTNSENGTPVSSPFRHAIFRWLWIASLVSNIGTWMQNVGAAWLMTDLSKSALMVALVQAATNLPMFFLALPAGALADIVDRRRLLLLAQGSMLVVTGALTAMTCMDLVTPWLLLSMTFLLGVGFALNAPAWQAITPELVSRDEVPAAIALGAVSLNVARAIGPALGGMVVAAAGPSAVFLLNALSFVGVLAVLELWRRPVETSVLPAERFVGAIRAGLRYVRYAPALRIVIVRALLFVVGGSSLWALLPVITKADPTRGATQYGILLACFGGGAALGATVLAGALKKLNDEQSLIAGTLVLAAVILGVAWLPFYPVWCALMLPAGVAWVRVLTALNASAQAVAPRWVRARALAVYLLAFYGGMAAGSMLWGEVATRLTPEMSLTGSAVWMIAGLLATVRLRLPIGEISDFDPSRHWPDVTFPPTMDIDRGPVVVTVEYWIDSARAEEFEIAIQQLRLARLRDGAVRWDLFQDAAHPGRFVEMFLVESVVEHLRQHERVTHADQKTQEHVQSFHKSDTPPLVTHLVAGFRGTDTNPRAH